MDLLKFLDEAVTPWHTSSAISNELLQAGFQESPETEMWNLQRGKSYFVNRGAALFAFRIPSVLSSETRFRLAASHTDFPTMKITPNPDLETAGIHLLHPEVYGGALLSSWFDRDLGIAGMVVVREENRLVQKRIRMNALCRIPELAIHLNRNVNEEGFRINPQTQLNVCFSAGKTKNFISALEDFVGSRVVDFDLQFFDAQPAALGGFHQEWIYSGRLDNLLSCDSILSGMVESGEPENVCGALFLNSEEVGSETRDGAAGNFGLVVLNRIADSIQMKQGELFGILSDSLLFSLDVAHATHPAYGDKMEPNHSPLMGQGVVLKENAKKRYASEAIACAQCKALCEDLQMPYQIFVSRNDMPCGSTVGPCLSAALGIPAVDLGEAILGMHSIREMGSVIDHKRMCQLMQSFFRKKAMHLGQME